MGNYEALKIMGIYFIQSTVVFLYSLDSGIRFPNVPEAGEISTN
jgi:hypothetical protein